MQWRLRNKDLYVGMTCKANFKTNPDYHVFGDVFIPVKIIAEYPKWWLTEVIPHKNPHGQGISSPYKMTLNKWDVEKGFIIIK